MNSKNRNIKLTAYDDLFSTNEQRQETVQEQVQTLPITQFYPFPDHPFQVNDDEKMADTVKSIQDYGVLVPILARPRPQGGYEIISGHRRHHAAQLAGIQEIPVIIRDMDDDEAILAMVDSNLQREQLLPSEKAFAYKMKLDAMRRKAGRPKHNNSVQIGQNFGQTSRELLASQSPDSNTQIQRYIRLTYLTKPILNMVDEGKFALNAAVEISYLPETHQTMLLDAMDYAQVSPSLAQSRRIREFFMSGKLDSNVMEAILSEEKPLERKITLRDDKLKQYFPASYTSLQMEKVITQLLEDWSRKQQKERNLHAR